MLHPKLNELRKNIIKYPCAVLSGGSGGKNPNPRREIHVLTYFQTNKSVLIYSDSDVDGSENETQSNLNPVSVEDLLSGLSISRGNGCGGDSTSVGGVGLALQWLHNNVNVNKDETRTAAPTSTPKKTAKFLLKTKDSLAQQILRILDLQQKQKQALLDAYTCAVEKYTTDKKRMKKSDFDEEEEDGFITSLLLPLFCASLLLEKGALRKLLLSSA